MIIYKITNNINGKVYIGQTINSIKERIRGHLKEPSGYFPKALRKYGIENFTIEAIDDSAKTIDELNFLERKYIKELNTLRPNGYNLQIGGLNKIVHEETKRKLSYSKHNPIDCKCLLTGITYSFRNIRQVKNIGFSDKVVERALKKESRQSYGFIWKYRNESFEDIKNSLYDSDVHKYRRNINDYVNFTKSKYSITGTHVETGETLKLDFLKDIEGLGGDAKYLAEILNGRRPYRSYKNYNWKKDCNNE